MADELKIWALREGNEAEPVASVASVTLEDVLEDTLVRRPEMLEAGLHLVGRQTPTEGGPLDLLGVDSDGRLVVYELKRGEATREAVTQCLDYGSWLAEQDIGELAHHIAERSGHDGIKAIPDFEEWYQSQFGDLDALLPPRLVLVALGISKRAERMANFLSQSDIDLSVLTFYGFKHGNDTLLARQVEVESNGAASSPQRGRLSITERRTKLAEWLTECGLADLFNTVCGDLRSGLPNCYEDPTGHGISFQLTIMGPSGVRGPRTYFSVLAGYAEPDSVTISLGGAALHQNEEAFNTFRSEANLRDWPHGKAGVAVFISSEEDWEAQRDAVLQFAEATVEAWQSYRNTPQTMA